MRVDRREDADGIEEEWWELWRHSAAGPFQSPAWRGRCGAHFVGLSAHGLPWAWYGRPASECIAENWETHLPELRRRVGPGWNADTGAGLIS